MNIVYRVSEESFTLDDFLRGDKEARREVCSHLLSFFFPINPVNICPAVVPRVGGFS